MTDAEIMKALDILEKLDFFGGQRAGRELWGEKPADIQNKDIESFSNDVAFLKDFINRLQSQNEALITGQETLQKALASKEAEIKNLKNACFCIVNERDAIGDCMSEAVEEAKAEAIKEFAKKVELEIVLPLPLRRELQNLVKEMVGEG